MSQHRRQDHYLQKSKPTANLAEENQPEVDAISDLRRLNTQSLSVSQIQTLQRTIGNVSTIRLLSASKQSVPASIQRDDDNVTGSDEDMEALNYETVVDKLVGKQNLKHKNIVVQPNGELFIEFQLTNAKPDKVQSQLDYSYDEKVHVPANLDDIAARTNIVAQVCMQMSFTSFKTTKPEKLSNVKAGSPIIFETLRQADLTDDAIFDEGKGIQSYLSEALRPGKKDELEKFFVNRLGKVPTDPSAYGFELSVIMDGVVADSGIFPSEQRGREITIYIDPGFKPESWWKNFAHTLVARMESENLPRLPIAKGDQPIRGEGMNVEGSYHAYFSSRDESMGMDTELGYFGFPTWYGGNAEKSRVSGKPLVFDMDLNEPDLNVDVESEKEETHVTAHVRRSKWKRFTHWLKKKFQD